MTTVIVAVSLAASLAGTWAALAHFRRRGTLLWLLPAAAMLLMALRRAYLLVLVTATGRELDLLNESMSLLIPLLLTVGFFRGLRGSTDPAAAGAAAAVPEAARRPATLTWAALGLGALALAGSVLSGLHAYRVSRDVMLEAAAAANLRHARLLVAHVESLHVDLDPSDAAQYLAAAWDRLADRGSEAHVALIGAQGRVLYDSADPDRAGAAVGGLVLEGPAGQRTDLASLLVQRGEWAGLCRDAAHGEQVSGFAHSLRLRSLVEVGQPRAEVAAGVWRAQSPWVLGLGFSALVLLPGALLLLHQGYQASHRAMLAAQRAQRDSDERFRVFFEFAPDGCYLAELNGTVIDGNRAAEQMVGYSRERFIGRNWVETGVMPPEEIPRALELTQRNAAGETTGPVEFALVRSDGSRLVAEVRALPVTLGGRTVILGIFRDVSERKRAEQAQRETEARFRDMVDNAVDIIYMLDRQGCLTYASNGLLHALGYRREELLGRFSGDLIHPDDQELTRRAFQARIAGQTVGPYEFRLLRKDGASVPVEIASHAVHDAAGGVIGTFAILRDLTERKQAEEALRRSEARLRAVFANAGAVVALTDTTGRLLDVNARACAILGYSHDELMALHVSQIAHPDDFPAVAGAVESMLRQGLPAVRGEKRCRRKDGQVIWVEYSVSPIRNGGGVVEALVEVATEITQRKEAEEALRESENKYRSLFDSSNDAVLLTAPDGRIFAANLEACRIFGRTEAELCQAGRKGLVDAGDPRLAVLLEERARTGKARGELTFVRKDGSRFPGEVSSAVFLDRQGEARTSMIVRDITQRQQAEQELRRREEMFRRTFEAIPDGAVLWRREPEGRITLALCNSATLAATGGRIADFLGWTAEGFFAGRPDIAADIRRAMEDGRPLQRGYDYALRTTGEMKSLVVDYVKASDDLVLSIARDVTQQRRIEAALRQGEQDSRQMAQRLEVLLRELDHRVRNNLAALYALVERYARPAGSVEQFAEAIRGKLLAMTAVHQIIASAGWQSVELPHLLRELARQFVADGRGDEAFRLQGPAIAVIPRQAGALAMVLHELFTNARKHGAYRVPAGVVRLAWTILEPGPRKARVRLQWEESGGPPVVLPTGQGQGLRLIQGLVGFELAGVCGFRFEPAGLGCDLEVELDQDAPAAPA